MRLGKQIANIILNLNRSPQQDNNNNKNNRIAALGSAPA